MFCNFSLLVEVFLLTLPKSILFLIMLGLSIRISVVEGSGSSNCTEEFSMRSRSIRLWLPKYYFDCPSSIICFIGTPCFICISLELDEAISVLSMLRPSTLFIASFFKLGEWMYPFWLLIIEWSLCFSPSSSCSVSCWSLAFLLPMCRSTPFWGPTWRFRMGFASVANLIWFLTISSFWDFVGSHVSMIYPWYCLSVLTVLPGSCRCILWWFCTFLMNLRFLTVMSS